VLDDVESVIKVRFTQKDVVRHPLVAAIVNAYDRDAKTHVQQPVRPE